MQNSHDKHQTMADELTKSLDALPDLSGKWTVVVRSDGSKALRFDSPLISTSTEKKLCHLISALGSVLANNSGSTVKIDIRLR